MIKFYTFLFFLCFSAILINFKNLFSKSTYDICNSDSKFTQFHNILNNKTIIFPKDGKFKTSFFKTRANAFWDVAGIAAFQDKDFYVYPSNVIEKMPHDVEKAHFYMFNICAFWTRDEDFNEFYFIDFPPEKTSIFSKTTILLSPQLFNIIEGKSLK